MKTTAISFQALTLLMTGIFIFTACQKQPDQVPRNSAEIGKEITGKLLDAQTSTPTSTEDVQSKAKNKQTFVSKEMNISFDYPGSWMHISNWQGERGEIFVENSDVDLFDDPKKNHTYLFIDNINEYEIIGWKEITQKEITNRFGVKFNLLYYSPDQEYYINRGITYLTPPVTETLIVIKSDVIPGTMHFKFDSAKNEMGEVNLMEILNTVARIQN